MEIGNQNNSFSTTPLTTISPRRANTNIVSNSGTAPAETSDDTQQQQATQKRAEQEIEQQNNRVVQQLKARDREVRAHEAAHAAVGGQYVTRGPSFTMQRGPDGRSYAIGGEVSIDASAVANDPEATLIKSETVRRAALAPAQPSPQDFRIAARSTQSAAQARIEIAVIKAEEAERILQERREALDEVEQEDSASVDTSSSVSGSENDTDTDLQGSASGNLSSDIQTYEPPDFPEPSVNLLA